MEFKKKTIIWEDNSEPPKDYIWIKPDGKAYEFDYTDRTWKESKSISTDAGSGSGSNVELLTLNVTENGEYTPDKGKVYNKVNVNVENSVPEGLYSVFEFLLAMQRGSSQYYPEQTFYFPETAVIYDYEQQVYKEITIQDIESNRSPLFLYRNVNDTSNNVRYVGSNGALSSWTPPYGISEILYNDETWYYVTNGD